LEFLWKLEFLSGSLFLKEFLKKSPSPWVSPMAFLFLKEFDSGFGWSWAFL